MIVRPYASVSRAERNVYLRDPKWSWVYERVLLAIVSLSSGDLGKLDHEISAACHDWRDALLAH
jgi:hypothetical protein